MLAISERLATDAGLTWALCDTDSMALARPEGIAADAFLREAQGIVTWFTDLNPYHFEGSIFKIVDTNYHPRRLKENAFEPLYAFAISAKRYALYNLDAEGRPVIRKASAHGLGHLLPPYGEEAAISTIPAPAIPLVEIGVERWQYDLWYRIILAAQEGHPRQVHIEDLPGLSKPAVSRYAATTPAVLRWFSTYNQQKGYRGQVKPFNFLLSFQAEHVGLPAQEKERILSEQEAEKMGNARRQSEKRANPVAPYHTDYEKSLSVCFDRVTGEPIEKDWLKTYREALLRYHLHPEAKFDPGKYTDSGFTQRKHLRVTTIDHIGKEANQWEQQYYTGSDENAQVVYGLAVEEIAAQWDEVFRQCRHFKARQIARAAEVDVSEVSRLLHGQRSKPTLETLRKLQVGLDTLRREQEEQNVRIESVIAEVKSRCRTISVRQFAKLADIDQGNLTRWLTGKRRPSQRELQKVASMLHTAAVEEHK